MLLVDTNVLVDVLEDDPEWADWSISHLRTQSKIHRLAINPIIYSELSLTFSTVEALDQNLEDLGLRMIEAPRPQPCFLPARLLFVIAGKGARRPIFLVIFIGAHAAVSGHPALTRDTRRYVYYFPSVNLIAPEKLV